MYAADAFEREIAARPLADAPRLVYADWLDEHGEMERAALIRVQCALTRLTPTDADVPVLRAQEQTLLRRHATTWARSVSGVARRWKFVRGFPSELWLTPGEFLRHGTDLCARVPVERLHLGAQYDLPALAESPALRHIQAIEWLSLCEATVSVLHSPHAEHLSELSIHYPLNSTTEARPVLQAPRLQQVRRLRLHLHELTLADLTCLGGLANLRQLETSLHPPAEPDLVVLQQQALFQRTPPVRFTLRPTANHAVANVLRLLQIWPSLCQGLHLDLSHWTLTPRDLEWLAAPPTFAGMTALNLSFVPLGPEPLRWLTHAPGLAGVRHLWLSATQLTPTAVATLVDSPLWPRLHSLDLSLNPLTPAAVRTLLRANPPPHLRTLDFIYDGLAPAHQTALANHFGPGVCLFTPLL
jgi:uncharacterized protein (TIGR02996 family)